MRIQVVQMPKKSGMGERDVLNGRSKVPDAFHFSIYLPTPCPVGPATADSNFSSDSGLSPLSFTHLFCSGHVFRDAPDSQHELQGVGETTALHSAQVGRHCILLPIVV
jgi:hypothetical protein